ncbi:aminoglycoside N(6')-acetyltransferase [Parapedobacter defluvii]|uniref:Aminoglycoside N(6')-acetyltransferase n=1 Tax=Parapedobacter defluvii TaxID=2045106 RepID=A0ABQ1MWH8_9SPHI|nr:GNAT family protein [Parapedobacter defluvii]GGC48378.1 aminoglycoside N(6')-acetyltransferase [Parapedobacter defluvii]
MAELILRRFEEVDFDWLQSWVTSPELLFQFSGERFSYPLSLEQLTEYRAEYPDRRMYIAWVQGQPMAFGEIIPQDNGRPRLGRILVGNPAIRGMGIGARFITALVDECGRLYDCDAVELNVWDENISAIRCYEKVGFVFQADDRTVLSAFGRTFNIHKMVKMR